MYFLIDENLPTLVGQIFSRKGAEVKSVREIEELRGKPDEVIFEFAVSRGALIVTRDLGFTNPERFDVRQLKCIIVLPGVEALGSSQLGPGRPWVSTLGFPGAFFNFVI